MTFGSLFAGIGGIDLGLERAGMTCRWQVEIDPACLSVLAKHWPDVPRYQDVRDVGRTTLPPVDLICGGFPCQDVSVAGRRAGLAGERSGLWHEFHRIVAEFAPRWVVIENVPGLLSSNGGRDLSVVLGGLAQLGYGWTYRVLDLRYFGVPQRRRRVFIVGRAGGVCPPEVLLEPKGLPGDPAARGEAGEAAPAIPASGAGTARTGNERTEASFVVANVLPTKYRGDPHEGTDTIIAAAADPISANEGRTYTHEGRNNFRLHNVVAHTFRKAQKAHHADDCERWEEDDQAAALDAAGHGPRTATAVVESAIPRRLTPTECERLQSFPDNWTRHSDDDRELADGPRYRMLGNAVPPVIAEWIGRRIMERRAES